jgi:hypothetical protein
MNAADDCEAIVGLSPIENTSGSMPVARHHRAIPPEHDLRQSAF